MRAEIEAQIGGETHKLALPIGGLEEVAKVNPYPVEVWEGLHRRIYRLDELIAVLRAGLKYGGSSLKAEAVIEGEGIARAAEIARDLMAAAFADDSGNLPAAATNGSDTSSPPDHTS